MNDPVEGIWNDAGSSTLRWLFAEALSAYQVWERPYSDFFIVLQGADLLVCNS
jgi:hypothetical protein